MDRQREALIRGIEKCIERVENIIDDKLWKILAFWQQVGYTNNVSLIPLQQECVVLKMLRDDMVTDHYNEDFVHFLTDKWQMQFDWENVDGHVELNIYIPKLREMGYDGDIYVIE